MPTSGHFPGYPGPLDVTLLRAVTPAIRRAVAKVLGQRHPDVDDTVQEALLAFVAAWRAFRGECPAAAYAGRIATREAIRTVRRERGRQRKLQHLTSGALDEEAPAPDTTHDPRHTRLVWELLDALPRAQRDALVHRVVDELSLGEVARLAGAPPNTIRSRVRMARDALRLHVAARPGLAQTLSLA